MVHGEEKHVWESDRSMSGSEKKCDGAPMIFAMMTMDGDGDSKLIAALMLGVRFWYCTVQETSPTDTRAVAVRSDYCTG